MTNNDNLHAAVAAGDDIGSGDGAVYSEGDTGDGRGDGWGYGYPLVNVRDGDGSGCGAMDHCRHRGLDGDSDHRTGDWGGGNNSGNDGDGWGIGDYS